MAQSSPVNRSTPLAGCCGLVAIAGGCLLGSAIKRVYSGIPMQELRTLSGLAKHKAVLFRGISGVTLATAAVIGPLLKAQNCSDTPSETESDKDVRGDDRPAESNEEDRIPEIVAAGGGDASEIAPKALSAYLGRGWITLASDYFAFFAIVTSVLGQALSLVHFLADGFKTPNTKLWKGLLCLLALVPPYLAALYNPRIFITALSLAGAYGAVVLFGIMPALMVWRLRYREKQETFHTVKGGRPLLVLIILFALGVMGIELAVQLGALS